MYRYVYMIYIYIDPFPICKVRVSRFFGNFPLFLMLCPSPRQFAKISSSLAHHCQLPRRPLRQIKCQKNIGHIECLKCQTEYLNVCQSK